MRILEHIRLACSGLPAVSTRDFRRLTRDTCAQVTKLLVIAVPSFVAGPGSFHAAAQETVAVLPASHERLPEDFAIIFNLGYAADQFPRDSEDFERLIQAVKQAHFNTVLCQFEDWRAEICRRHGVKIFVDLLVPDHHVYKNVDGARALCQRLRGNDTVWGYHLWSDRIGGTVAGRNRDMENVRQWDPTHPTYVGSYHARSLDGLSQPDVIGYYDFHWFRGGHWRHLFRARSAAASTGAVFLRYCQANPGRVGAGNYNRVLYTISTSIAFGLKGYLFHSTGEEIDTETWQWRPLGQDLARVNAEIAPLGPPLMQIGNPTAVYSTPLTKTAKDRPLDGGAPAVPAEFETLPADGWLQVDAGEVVVGLFRDDQSRDVVYLANHNAYQPQQVGLRIRGSLLAASLFDRSTAQWRDLPASGTKINVVVPPAAGELLRFERSRQSR